MKKKKITIWHNILTVAVLIIGSVCIIIIMPFVLLNDLLFGRYRGWNFNYNIFRGLFRVGFFLSGIRLRRMYEAPHDPSRKYMFVLNHNSYLDIPVMMTAIRQPIRVLSKIGLHRIPVFGYYYRKSTVMVDRESTASRVKSMKALKHYLDKGISVVIFPEGTFNESNHPLKNFFDGAFRIAIETQTNIKPVIMPDNHDRCYRIGLSLEPGRTRAIFLPEVSVQGMTLKDAPKLRDAVYSVMEAALVKYGAGWIADGQMTNVTLN